MYFLCVVTVHHNNVGLNYAEVYKKVFYTQMSIRLPTYSLFGCLAAGFGLLLTRSHLDSAFTPRGCFTCSSRGGRLLLHKQVSHKLKLNAVNHASYIIPLIHVTIISSSVWWQNIFYEDINANA